MYRFNLAASGARSCCACADAEDVFGELGHTAEQGAAAGKDRAAGEQVTEVGVLERIAHVLEDLAGAVLQDLAYKVGVVVAAVELDDRYGVDGAREDRPVCELQLFGLLVSDL